MVVGFHANVVSVDLTNTDVTQNFVFSVAKLTITAKDSTGNPVAGMLIGYKGISGTTDVDSGNNTYPLPIIPVSSGELHATTDTNGAVTLFVLQGATYDTDNICATFTDQRVCNSGPVTVTGDTSVTLQDLPPIPNSPTNLSAASPAQHPALTWDAVSGVTSYNIYRNGTQIDSSSTPGYTDSSAPEGVDTYYVTAVNGGSESGASNSVGVLVDRTPPVITYTPSPAANSNGWNNSDVTVTFHCSDTDGSGVASCTDPVTLHDEAAGQTVTGTATDNAGNTANVTATVNIDKTDPAISYSVAPAPNANGWNNSDVTVTFACDDVLSDITSCTQPVIVSTDGASQVVTGTAIDKAGNTNTVTVMCGHRNARIPNAIAASPRKTKAHQLLVNTMNIRVASSSSQ